VWQGLLALKNNQASVQMYYVTGHKGIARFSVHSYLDGYTPLRITQCMRLEPNQLEGVKNVRLLSNKEEGEGEELHHLESIIR